jgi:hypothetical protein
MGAVCVGGSRLGPGGQKGKGAGGRKGGRGGLTSGGAYGIRDWLLGDVRGKDRERR